MTATRQCIFSVRGLFHIIFQKAPHVIFILQSWGRVRVYVAFDVLILFVSWAACLCVSRRRRAGATFHYSLD